MNNEDYTKELGNILEKLNALPEHSPKECKTTAAELESLHADLRIGRMDFDVRSLNKKIIMEQFDAIRSLSFEELQATRNIEAPYTEGDKEDWCRYARISRMGLLLDRYTLLCRLRSNDPQAWDEINELFFDD